MEPPQRLYIQLPDDFDVLQLPGEWDHGVVVTDLNPHLTESEFHNYFETFGTITECVFKMEKSSQWPKGMGFVRYSSAEEAKAAESRPHYLGGFHLQIKKVITPKLSAQNRSDNQLNGPPCQSFQAGQCVN
ncbi:RNA-binding protein 1 [Carassius auratus]|uniref:RNA-binding protein 1 n=1 Tax=Carassius auratus TaxID=7957 RepID=A0A6P6JY23_CARAU|nr:RNA-binding protein 1-like [Carassius auratus]